MSGKPDIIPTEACAWPDLVPLDQPNLPRLNLDCLPDTAKNFARALSDSTETPPELAASMVLVTCSVASARILRVTINGDYSEPTNLWMVTALPSGNRKSAVQSATAAPLIQWEHDQEAKLSPEIGRISSMCKTLEARANELRKGSAKERDTNKSKDLAEQAAELEAEMPCIPTVPQLWTSDATPERLGTLLADNDEKMAWLSFEGGIFELLQGRYSSGIPNLDLVLKCHSGDSERVDRGSRPPVYLRTPLLTVGLSPQPEVLRGLATKPGFRGRGLLARFNICCHHRR